MDLTVSVQISLRSFITLKTFLEDFPHSLVIGVAV